MTPAATYNRLVFRLVLVAVVVFCLLIPITALRLPAALLVLCVLPALTISARANQPFLGALALACTVSPPLFAFVSMLVMSVGVQPYVAVWITAAVCLLLYLLLGTPGFGGAERNERKLFLYLLIILLATAALVLTLPLTNEWWRVRSDSWFHAAVFNRLSNHGLPAVDPYFSPLRLKYMYMYHIFLIGVSTLTGLGPFFAMIFGNFVALLGCVLGFNYLARRFTRHTGALVLGNVFCLYAMNGLFYLFFVVRVGRAYIGHTTGEYMLKYVFPLSPPGLETATKFLCVEGNQDLFLDKFMLGTAVSLTFGLICVVLALLIAARNGKRDGPAWNRPLSFLFVAALAGILHLHLITGVIVLVATVGSLIVARFGGRLLLLALAALLVALPYIINTTPRGGGGESVGLAVQGFFLLGLLACVLPALPPAVSLLRRNRPWEPGRGLTNTGLIGLWILIVAAMAAVINLPTTNETKFSFPLFIPLAALAAGGFGLWMEKRRRIAAVIVYVALCTIPLNAVYFALAFQDPSQYAVSDSEKAVYEWIQTSTTEDAIFLEQNDNVRVPVLAARDLYWGTEGYAHNWGYPDDEMDRRRALRAALFGGGELARADLEPVAALGKPFYIMMRDSNTVNKDLFKMVSRQPFLKERFSAGDIVVFEVELD